MSTLRVRAVLPRAGFALDAMGFGKWASTRRKLAPLVRAIVQGPPALRPYALTARRD